jgi:hypothetical protein
LFTQSTPPATQSSALETLKPHLFLLQELLKLAGKADPELRGEALRLFEKIHDQVWPVLLDLSLPTRVVEYPEPFPDPFATLPRLPVRWEITGSAAISARPDADGHYYRLLRDGVKVCGGSWAHCYDSALHLAMPGDTLTSGSDSKFVNRPIEEEWRQQAERLKGPKVEED